MEWNFHGDAPIYAQLVEQIKRKIVSGEYIPGQRIPAVRELAQEAGVNPNTMQRAMQELERQGLLFSLRTSGRFVTEEEQMIRNTRDQMARELTHNFLEQISGLGCSEEEIRRLLAEAVLWRTGETEGGEIHGKPGME